MCAKNWRDETRLGAPMTRKAGGRRSPAEHHALRVLEFEVVLDAVAKRATSGAGRARVKALVPLSNLRSASDRLARVEAVRELAERSDYTGVPAIPVVDGALETLSVEGSMLAPSDLYHVAVLLQSGATLERALAQAPDALAQVRDGLHSDRALAKKLETTVDADGTVLDRASPELARIRREIQKTSAAVVRSLEKYAASLPDAYRVEDASVTLRGGRYVVPIRREGRSQVGGIVHDESASGATLFVEPPQQVERMNRLRHLEGEEQREIARILADRTEAVRPSRAALATSLDVLVEYDALTACARTASVWGATVPELVDPLVESDEPAFKIVAGRHPLLLEKGVDVVPFDLTLEGAERVLVVSGPNTGGKTVLLKALGLIPLMAQCGIVPPVEKGSRIPLFDAVFADIGDEQSIQDDLSTFSGHIANVSAILDDVSERSLVLLDELGTGTDPSEGAALARAVLERLADEGTRTVATSHLGALKRIAEMDERVVNASLQFDSEALEPTYRLVKGRPGRSFGIQIAKRLSLPEELVTRALELLDDTELRADALLARLEQDEREMRELLERLEVERAEAAAMLQDVTGREAQLRDRERAAETRAREEARRMLMDARSEVERAIREGREAAGKAEAEKAARRSVERAAARVAPKRSGGRKTREKKSKQPRRDAAEIHVGQRVRMTNGAAGTVVDLDGSKASVELDGGVRLKVRLDQLQPISPEVSTRPRGRTQWTEPAGAAVHEVDLRGLRVDEVEPTLLPAIDRAVLSDLPTLRIIHGMGTGAVRTRVGELVERDPRIDQIRSGERGEGGAGVTVVTFR